MKHRMIFPGICALLFFATSCVNSKQATYFNNITNATFEPLMVDIQSIIQKNDLLSISVSSLNPGATIVFNTSNAPSVAGSSAAGTATELAGYLVNEDGFIKFPVLGNVMAAGLSKKQLTDNIAKSLVDKKLLIDPIVTTRFLNFKVTVLGEVAKPTVVSVANEKISILEAIGMAGDLTIYAKRDNVVLIREENGRKTVKRINLNSAEIFTSPDYYLKTNDVIYVEPNKAKVASASSARQSLPLILSSLAIVATILTRVF